MMRSYWSAIGNSKPLSHFGRGRGPSRRLGRVREIEPGEDRGLHRIGIAQNRVVPEAEHTKALPAQICVTAYIVVAVAMLRAICLDDQPLGQGHEVGDVEVYDLLPAELAVNEPTI